MSVNILKIVLGMVRRLVVNFEINELVSFERVGSSIEKNRTVLKPRFRRVSVR